MARTQNALVWDLSVKIDGKEWPGFEINDVDRFEWRESINEAPTGRLAVRLDMRQSGDTPKIEDCIGKEIEVVVAPPGASEWEVESGKAVFKGEVHAAERTQDASKSELWTLVFRHRVHRLTQRAGCKMWAAGDYGDNKHTDVISQVINSAGLTAKGVDSSKVNRNALLQYRETDFNFLLRLVEDAGMWLVFDHADGKSVKVTKSGNDVGEIDVNDLLDWKIVSATTPNTTTLRSPANPTKARVGALEGEASNANATGKKAFGDLPVADFDVAMAEEDNAKAAAEALLHALGGPGLRLDAMIDNVMLFAGDEIKIAASSLNDATGTTDKYLVTDSETTYTPDGVTTRCSAIMRDDKVLPPRKAMRPRIDGVLPAIVTKSQSDTDELARVRVKFPWADNEESAWARVVQNWSGKQRGSVYLPHVDDEVLVAFEHGDPAQPIVLGGLYNSENKPPLSLPSEWTKTVIKTKKAHMLTFEDKDDEEFIQLETGKAAHKLRFDDKPGKEFVELETGKKKHTMRFDDKDEFIELASGKKHNFKMDDKGGKIELKSAKGAKMVFDDNGQKITIEVGGCSIELAPAGITIKAPKVDIKADAMATVKGAMAEVSASGVLTLKGSMTKIN